MKSKRILSLILALLMLFSVLPFSALAEDDELEETESVSEDDAFASSDPFEGLTDETQSADDPPQDENRAEDEAPNPADSDLPDEGSDFDEDSQDADEDWSEDDFQQSDSQITDESEDEIESYEGTDGETEFSEGPDDPPADDEQEETGESDGGEESDALDDSEEMQESNFSLDDLVLTEYDGSYIWYTIESSGHAYVKTKQAAPVYRDSGMNPAAVLCTLPDGEVLLATDYDDRSETNAVFVTVVTPEMDVVEGFIRESDLSKTVVTDDEIDLLTVERDYLMIDANGTSCPALVSAASFYGADSESNTDGEASEDYDTDPDDTGEESDENGENSETGESFEDDELKTVTLDPVNLQIQTVEPIRLMGTRSYTYTIYADHDPTVPISTRPTAYMAGNRQGFTTIDQGNDGSDFKSIHESYNMKGQTVTVLGFSRYHHAVITCEWYDSSAGITRRLLTEAAYMRPVEKTYTCTVRDASGNIVPNHEVRVLDGKGNYVTTVMSDANGVARYTGLHLEVSDMLAFAEANYYENGTNTLIEDNDCATFVSECLTAGGFAVYGAYASNSEANEGQIGYGLYDRLTSWIGVPGTSYPSISTLSPGDVVFMHPQNNANYPYGHSMIIGQVDYASGQVLVYGHSSANKQEGDSNKMWISVSRIAYVAFTSMYNYTFDYSFTTPTPVPTTPPTQLPTKPPTQPPTAPPTSAPTPTPAPAKGRIKIIKTDALDGTPIAGVVFDIYQGSTKVGSMTTNANGIAESGQLPKGNYTVKEHALPQGYTGSLANMDCVVKSAETTGLKATNQPIQFRVKIVKKDGLTKESLPGAEFTITRKTGLPSHNSTGNGEVVATLTTDANGEALSDLLTWGEYEVKETKVPEHFVDNHFVTTVTGSENDRVYEIRVENEPTKGWIRLVKTDRLDGTPIAGVVFDILQNGRVVSTMTTGADGVAISAALHKGKYTVKEHANPTGYTNDLVALDCEVYSDVITRLTTDNQPIQGRIRIMKRDELTKEALAGAEFTVTRVSGLPSHNGSNDGEVVTVIVTDADGIAVTPLLTWGTYKIEETGVPVHYVDNHFSANVIIKDDNLKTYDVPVENEPTKGWIQLVKTDALDRTPIAGVQFDIYYNGEYGSGLAATMTTNAEGVARSIALRKGKYLVKEHSDPTGYVTDLVTLDCAVRSDETTNLSCTNTPIQGRIRIIKTDELTKEALAGAEFTITRVSGLPSHNGSNNGEVAAVIVTDADGIVVTPLLTWGTYKVEETGVPVHYVDNHFSTEVIIDTEDLLTYDVPCENEPTKGWIRLTKTDRKNGNPISGVQFDIYYNDQYGEGLATTMTTGSDGVAMSEPIRKGRYIVKEHGATAGYLFEEVTLECTVKSDEITDLAATNRPVGVKLKLFKRDKDEYTGRTADTPGTRGDAILTGAVFQVLAGENITDCQGNILYAKGAVVVESLKTAGEEASVTTDELWPGVYEIVELTPPTGYQPTEQHTIVDATGAARQSTEAVITYKGVVKNEVRYGCYAFVKFCGDNEIHDDAGLVETPEEGAVFQIYLKAAGSYDAAQRYERDIITTDQYGKAKTRLLPYGIYTVQQTKARKGFAIKAPFDIFIRGTEDPDSPPSMILNNEAIRYRLKFIKIDAETGKTITAAHTSFKLKDSEGNHVTQTVFYPHKEEIDTFTTDETGAVTLPETVNYGLYFAEEFQVPEGYLIQTREQAVFVGDESMDKPGEAYLLEFRIENEAVKGRILLEKKGLQLTGFREQTDENGNTCHQPAYKEKYLAGAVFEVYAAEDVIGKDGTLWYHADELVDTITTTAEGRDASRVLPLGKYYLIETAAPEGYIFSDERYEANLQYVDDRTALVEITVQAGNDYLPDKISLTKEKEDLEVITEGENIRQTLTVTPGAGFLFGLYNDQDIRYEGGTLLADTLVATGATDAEGNLTFSGMYPHGKYYIKELSAPDGWKLNPDTFPVLLSPDSAGNDNMIHVSLLEPVHDDLIYTRVALTKTDITGQQTVPGALIEVSDEAGNIIYRAYTDENGEIPDIPVTPGQYTFREILAPEGYELNTAEMIFSVDRDLNVTGDTVIQDDYTRLYLLKLDENGRALPGVEFGLLNENDEILFTAMSDENGVVTFERIPYGTYTVMEKRPLPGYVSDGSTVEITVDGTFINPTLPLETIVNRKNVVLVKKVDQDGMALPGAEFVLCNEFGERVTTAVSDRNGIVKFTGIPYGNYTIREIIAPKGYLLNREVISLTVDMDFRSSEEPIATVVNRMKRLKYIKVDTSGIYLPGVEFSLINAATGEVVETVTSNENGEFFFTQFDYGVWIIRETEAPEGYNHMEDIMVSVDSEWVEPEPFTCVNIPNHYEFVKTDNEGNPLPGVKFTLEDSEGNILRDLVSGEDGIVHMTDLNPGTYIIREIETLEGFTVSSETIEVVIDEHYIIPDEMFTLMNYPIIQTGTGLEMTPLMWAGAGIIGAAILLGVVFAIRGKGKKKRHRGK